MSAGGGSSDHAHASASRQVGGVRVWEGACDAAGAARPTRAVGHCDAQWPLGGPALGGRRPALYCAMHFSTTRSHARPCSGQFGRSAIISVAWGARAGKVIAPQPRKMIICGVSTGRLPSETQEVGSSATRGRVSLGEGAGAAVRCVVVRGGGVGMSARAV